MLNHSRRAIFAAPLALAAAPVVLASPLTDMAHRYAEAFDTFEDRSRDLSDEETDAAYDAVTDLADGVYEAPCRSMADVMAKLRCMNKEMSLGAECPAAREVISQIVSFLGAS